MDGIENIIITDHAAKRLRQRLGISKKAAKKFAIDVFKKGDILERANKDIIVVSFRNAVLTYGWNLKMGVPVLVTAIDNTKITDERTVRYERNQKIFTKKFRNKKRKI